MKRIPGAALICLAVMLAPAGLASAAPKKMQVKAATRIDWTFAVSNKSLAKPPAGWLGDYDSTKQEYDLAVPASVKPQQPAGLVLFINAGGGPAGLGSFEAVCNDKGLLFASPYNAGNNVDPKKRVRLVLDVLDDIRRRYKIDPDRTYIAGFSGGARIACSVAYALPEYFGGTIPVCAVNDLREETWLRHRVKDRLSLALITGENDFNRPEVERLWGPIFIASEIRTRIFLCPKMGHAVPGAKEMTEVVTWLEEDVKRRRDLAKEYPTSRANEALTREGTAEALMKEGKARIKDEDQLYSGLMQIKGVMERFDGMPIAAEAKKMLLEYDAKNDKPWELKETNERRRLILATARALSEYVGGPLPKQYEKERGPKAKEALQLWQFIEKDGAGTKAAVEAKERIAALQKIVEKEK
jgi:dienelactone hydrolase